MLRDIHWFGRDDDGDIVFGCYFEIRDRIDQ